MSELNSRKRAKWILGAIALICVAPMIIAWFLVSSPPRWIGMRVHGSLIQPAIPVARSEFVAYDQFSEDHISEISGRWVLIHFVSPECAETCRASMAKTRQVWLMLNKDLLRLRRVAVVMGHAKNGAAHPAFEDPYLLRVRSTKTLESIAASLAGSAISEGNLLVMDPIGNLMMWFPADFDPYGLKKDLQRLLAASQIG